MSKRARTAASDLYRVIAEYTYDWETWVDADGVPRWINPAVERVTGYSVEACLARPDYPLGLALEADRPVLERVLEDAARGGSGNDVEFRVLHQDGTPRWVAISWQAVRSADGAPQGYRTSVRDIDQRKRIEQELQVMRQRAEAAVVARTELLANVSHELRSPAHCIAGFAELLAASALDASQKHYVQLIRDQCRDMLRQVEDLLQIAAFEAGGLRLESRSVDLEDVLQGLVEAARHTAQARGLALHTELALAQRWVLGDATRIGQIWRNLLENALKFTERGEVRVRLESSLRDAGGCAVCFEVRDTGVGMRAEDAARLMEPFQQGDAASTRRAGGVGLGLAIANQLARSMAGRLEFTSALGQGTRARALLNLPATEPAAPAPVPSAAPPRTTGRALVVDDSAPARELLCAMLELAGWQATAAATGAAARELAAAEAFDLVLLDYQMPDADGAQVARELREISQRAGRRTGIYLLTANLFIREQLGEFAAADGILAKPLSRADLFSLLHGVARAAPTPAAAPLRELDPLVIEDLQRLEGRDGSSVLARMARNIESDQARELDALERALGAEDWQRVARSAHAVAGQAAVVGARGVARAAAALETAAEQRVLTRAQAEQSLAELRAAWQRAADELATLVT